MTYHVPMCKWCGEHEVGSIGGSDEFCSPECQDAAWMAGVDDEERQEEDPLDIIEREVTRWRDEDDGEHGETDFLFI